MRYLRPMITLTTRVGPTCPAPSPDPDVPYSCIRWPVHSPPSEDNRNVHQTRSHGFDLLPLSSGYPSPPTCLSFPTSNLNAPQLSHSPPSRRSLAISTSPPSSSLSESTLAQVRPSSYLCLVASYRLFQRRHSLHSICPPLARCLRSSPGSPSQTVYRHRPLDRPHRASTGSYRVYRYIDDFRSLSSLLLIFLVECMYKLPCTP